MSKEIDKAIEQTRDAYNQVAIAYDAFTTHFHTLVIYPKIIALVEKFAESLSGKTILDVGCGSGGLIRMLDKRGAKCYGVDITPAFVEIARSRNSRVAQASMHSLPLPGAIFDVVVSNYVLNYLPSEGQELALREKFRVLKSGGVMVFTYMHPFFMRISRYRPTPPHYFPVTKNYFQPAKQEAIEQLGQKFVLHLLDWPEIANLTIRSGFHLQELVDAEVPKNLEEIAEGVDHEVAAQFVRSFRYHPYAMFVVATK